MAGTEGGGDAARDEAGKIASGPDHLALCTSQLPWILPNSEALKRLTKEGRQSLPHGTVEKGLKDVRQ